MNNFQSDDRAYFQAVLDILDTEESVQTEQKRLRSTFKEMVLEGVKRWPASTFARIARIKVSEVPAMLAEIEKRVKE